jgi:hypothetical protein
LSVGVINVNGVLTTDEHRFSQIKVPSD